MGGCVCGESLCVCEGGVCVCGGGGCLCVCAVLLMSSQGTGGSKKESMHLADSTRLYNFLRGPFHAYENDAVFFFL